ncbi:MAG: diaminopimelate decarboxylase [Rhodospirillales bacterium]|nr:diaminopimelate decarboxylase [Rhodospirillales bacterium]MBO6785317.1 diaminopimelate decarboxylase [Rhodospirillales bacterium]
MDHFNYRNGELYAEDVRVADIADTVGTPFYCYSTATLTRHYTVFDEALAGTDHQVYFAVKANGNIGVLATLARLGAGADIVSIGEMHRAHAAGIPSSKIVFSGVGKTADELRAALAAGVHQINVESLPELHLLSEIAAGMGVDAPVAIRVNPDVDAKTHKKITTGLSENKFGIAWEQAEAVFAEAASLPGIDVVGVAVHIGSQLTDLAPYRAAYTKVRGLVETLRGQGHDIRVVDLGGGLGIPYDAENPPSPADYGAMVKEVTGDLGCQLGFEPGRMICGNAGILVSSVIYVKEGVDRSFLILDAAMNDLIRPAMYEAHHTVVPVREPATGDNMVPVDIVGPICESGDTFAKARMMPRAAAGDLVAFRSAGAYGAVMASTYNGRDLIPEVLVNGAEFSVVAARLKVDDIMSRESVPDWLGAPLPRDVPKEASG